MLALIVLLSQRVLRELLLSLGASGCVVVAAVIVVVIDDEELAVCGFISGLRLRFKCLPSLLPRILLTPSKAFLRIYLFVLANSIAL